MLKNILNRREPIRIKKVRAARAVFESEEVQRIDLDINLESGDKLRLELTPRIAYQLLTQMGIAYNAIHPRLPNPNSANFYGMGE